MEVRIEELCRDQTHVACAHDDVVVLYSTATPDRAIMERLKLSVLAYGPRYPAGLGLLVLIAADEPPPHDEARRAILECWVGMKSSLRAIVLVVEGEGFAAAAKRSVITLLTLASSAYFPIKVARNQNEGAHKLVDMFGPRDAASLRAAHLTNAAAAVRAALRP